MTLVSAGSADEIYEAVRERILSGALPPPAPVRQEALAQSLGVSKIPLREALARLEQDGLLGSARNRGYFVRPLDADEAEEIFALRLKIEPEVAGLACTRASAQDQEAARAALLALDHEIDSHGSRVGVLNRAFHLALARPARQPVTLQLLERLLVLSDRYVREHLEPPGRDQRADSEHHRLFERWAAREQDEVARATAAHIESTLQDLRRQLAPDSPL